MSSFQKRKNKNTGVLFNIHKSEEAKIQIKQNK